MAPTVSSSRPTISPELRPAAPAASRVRGRPGRAWSPQGAPRRLASLLLAAALLLAAVVPAGAAAPPFLVQWGVFGAGPSQFKYPSGVALDAAGNVYVADAVNHRIQKFTAAGAFLVQWGTPGVGPGQFNAPIGVAVGPSGVFYVADTDNHRVQRFTAAGAFLAKWGSQGSGDGQFNDPYGVAVDAAGGVYVADYGNARIQRFSSTGAFLDKWGTPGTGDGQFNTPYGVAVDGAGTVYVADTYNYRIQQFAGPGAFLDKWGTSGAGDGQFNIPTALAVNAAGTHVYVADTFNHRIQVFAPGAAGAAPEACLRFDDATRTFQLYARDGGPPAALTPASVANVPGTLGQVKRRTYAVAGAPGHTLGLVVDVQQASTTAWATIVSLRYDGGPLLTAPPNFHHVAFQPSNPGVAQLTYWGVIGSAAAPAAQAVQSQYANGQTSSTQYAPVLAASGANSLQLLCTATNQGQLTIEL